MRASLTYKKLARYGNPTWQQKVRFGELLESSNKKLAIGTYENALDDISRSSRNVEDGLPVLKRLVALEPTHQNYLRLGELCSQVGDHPGAAAAFLHVAQLAESSGASPATWVERAYTEDSSDPQIALAYGKSLLAQGEVGAAIFILEPHVQAGSPSLEMRDAYTKALISAKRLVEAEPLLWQLFEQNPTRVQQVADLIGAMVDSELDAEGAALARKLEQFQRRRGERRSFIALMQDVVANHRASPDLLEFLGELFNSSNRETDYSQTLLKLFDLYASLSNYDKAGECLDRAAEVDPYEPGHNKRLELLRGKIDEKRFRVIASRFTSVSKSTPEPSKNNDEPTLGAGALQDLMLQAEILVQYGMRTKAIERLQRIQELFPREEERNEDLQRLYIAAGMSPHRAEDFGERGYACSGGEEFFHSVCIAICSSRPGPGAKRRSDGRQQPDARCRDHPEALSPEQRRCCSADGGSGDRDALASYAVCCRDAQARIAANDDPGIDSGRSSGGDARVARHSGSPGTGPCHQPGIASDHRRAGRAGTATGQTGGL